MTQNANVGATALDATVVTGQDNRTDEERSADERRQAENTVERLKIKREKAAQHLADAEQALADAEAELEGGE